MLKLVLNVLAFKVTWLACVVGAANGIAWAGPLFWLGFFLFQRGVLGSPRGEWKLAASIAALGFCVDSLYVLTGLVAFDAPWPSAFLAPIWIVAMWANYALTLNHSMRWFQDHLIIAASVGAVAGPGAYLAGRALGAVEFLVPNSVMLPVLAVVWGLAVPLTLWLARRFDRPASVATGLSLGEASR